MPDSAFARRAFHVLVAALGFMATLISPARAQSRRVASATELKKLSLEELLDLEVTLVTRRPEKLTESPSAVQVITGDDVRRSAAFTLPEALRLAPNLQVAQQNAHDWAITSRGFNGAPLANNSLADKLLVMIDGRSVYTPLFGGVFWDVQHVMLEDVERIEVVSGPGASLWGANAVNGVINVVTRSARDTQGLYAGAALGTFIKDAGEFRYGGRAGDNLYYRVYGQRISHDGSYLPAGPEAGDPWHLTRGGVRTDYHSAAGTLTFRTDVYRGAEGKPTSATVNGQNVVGRWTGHLPSGAELMVQAYWDRTSRRLPVARFADILNTFDLDVHHQWAAGNSHTIIWGGNVRLMRDEVQNTPAISFDPAERRMELFSGFVQDEIELVPGRWRLTLGSKVERNDYSGTEIQPSARVAWYPRPRQLWWAAVSRAVRSPARFDADVVTPSLQTPGHVFDSEKVIAHELGFRAQPARTLSISVAGFINRYDDLRSLNTNPAPPDFIFANDQKGKSWGVEVSGTWQPAAAWRLRGGYTYLDVELTAENSRVVTGSDRFEATDPRHRVMLHSMWDLPGGVQLDASARYVSTLPASPLGTPEVPAYVTADLRLAWTYRRLELALVGRNLLDHRHPEFGGFEMPRNVFVKAAWRY